MKIVNFWELAIYYANIKVLKYLLDNDKSLKLLLVSVSLT